MKEDFKQQHLARIHRVQDFIEQHLDQSLSLEEIASIAHFSTFHFHRLYTTLMGEPLHQFIQRIRLERAAFRLRKRPREPILGIALDLGFSSSATFARAFKEHFGKPPSAYRRKEESPCGHSAAVRSRREDEIHRLSARSITVRDLPTKNLAYIRSVGPYAGDASMFARLWKRVSIWAESRGLMGSSHAEFIAIYHDDPDITDQERLRISLGVTVPPDTKASGAFNLMNIPAGRYVCALFEISANEFAAAWNQVLEVWMPASGWQTGDGPSYECYLNNPKPDSQNKNLVEIRISIKPM